MKHFQRAVFCSCFVFSLSPICQSHPHRQLAESDRLRIGIHLYNDVRVSNEEVKAAKGIASHVFDKPHSCIRAVLLPRGGIPPLLVAARG